ncbi:MAG: YbeD family protein [Gammaproteobacteria bacterium]
MTDTNAIDDLFDFPCDFPIKIMGQDSAALKAHVETTANAQNVAIVSLTERSSSKGNYVALTLTVKATSRAQLDALYQAIGANDNVKAML